MTKIKFNLIVSNVDLTREKIDKNQYVFILMLN